MLYIGRDIKSNENVYIDNEKSHAVLICGKRGSGKSYTLGVLIEELMEQKNFGKDSLIIVIDPMGIYYTMVQENYEQEELLWQWGLSPSRYPVRILVPGHPEELYGGGDIIEAMEHLGVEIASFKINPSDLSPEGWCELFDLGLSDVMGISLFRAVRKLKRSRDFFTIDEIISEIESDPRASDKTKQALINRLDMAKDWGVFSEYYVDTWSILDKNAINVFDLSPLDPGARGRRNLVVSVLAKQLFKHRTIARRKEGLGLPAETPKVWMFIDEAHQFVPSGKSTLSKEILIRWVKEGRQPGLSLVLATQQPSALDSEVLSQCDIIFVQKLTNKMDISAVNNLSHDYMGSELKVYIRKLNRKGQAVLLDDYKEEIKLVQIRPRKSRHGGGE